MQNFYRIFSPPTQGTAHLDAQADGEARASHPDNLQHARVPELLRDALEHEVARRQVVVGLDGPDVVGMGLVHRGHQVVEVFPELGAERLRADRRAPPAPHHCAYRGAAAARRTRGAAGSFGATTPITLNLKSSGVREGGHEIGM